MDAVFKAMTQSIHEYQFASTVLIPYKFGPFDPQTQAVLRHTARLLTLHRTDPVAYHAYFDALSVSVRVNCLAMKLGCLTLGLTCEESIRFLTTFADNLELEMREKEFSPCKIGGTA